MRLGGYELCAKIADGGMATVHVARRVDGPNAGEIVAIKMIREEFSKNPEFLTMFMDEAKIVATLSHRNVLRYHELGSDGGNVFLAMELLYGQSLWSVWEACRARGVRLRYGMIAWIGARVADGLHYAHELVDAQGRALEIVHRDVNATNVFVTYDGEVKVIDFGLAKAANRASKTAAGVIKGKVAYMSPEQAVGAPVDPRTDVFALATTLWELACDRRLFKREDDVETLRRVHAAEVPAPTKLVDGFPPALSRILERALARKPEGRYASAAAFARELDTFARGTGGDGVDARAVGEAMRDLFAGDVARQRAWVAEVSAPGGRRAPSPLKTRSTFSGLEAVKEPAPLLPPPERAGLPGTQADFLAGHVSMSPAPVSRARVARNVVIAIVVVVAAVFLGALWLR